MNPFDRSVQWMTAGRGMLHEEMWVTDLPNHELYQVNPNCNSESLPAPSARVQQKSQDARTVVVDSLRSSCQNLQGFVRVSPKHLKERLNKL